MASAAASKDFRTTWVALVDLARSVEQLELVPETLRQPHPGSTQQQEAAQASEEEPAPAAVSASGLFAGETCDQRTAGCLSR